MTQEITTIQKILNTIVEFLVNYSFQVIGACIILAVGLFIANWVGNMMFRVFQKKNMDITLSKFFSNLVRIGVIGFAALIALGKFGITITPFIAALGAASFGASLALQGPLANFGAGFSIIMSRPFAVGDTITVGNVSGVVQDIRLTSLVLIDEDGVQICVPSKHLVGEIVHNSKKNQIVEGTIGIGYDSNPEIAVEAIRKALQKFPEVNQQPIPQIGIQKFGDFAVEIGYRYWIPTVKYFQLSYAINLAIYKAIQEARISIPFPQREIRIISQAAAASLASGLPQS